MTKQFTELTDSQWAAISLFLNMNRKRKLCLRTVCNAILHILRTGCQWRNLPACFPHWRAVNYYFEKWKKDDTFDLISHRLNADDRVSEGREACPWLLCIDSQSVKLPPLVFEQRGTDAHKKVNGRKRHLLVDSGGRIWNVRVGPANAHDGTEGCALLAGRAWWMHRLARILGDGPYLGRSAERAGEIGVVFERASRPESAEGFVPVAFRWVVERTISWTNFFRRLVKDYEYTVESSVAWLVLANITIMLQRMSG